MGPARKVRLNDADRLKAKAEALKDTVRFEDLQIWKMEKEKTTKKGSKTFTYWMTSWREDSRCRMSIWADAGRWMRRLQGRRPERLRLRR